MNIFLKAYKYKKVLGNNVWNQLKSTQIKQNLNTKNSSHLLSSKLNNWLNLENMQGNHAKIAPSLESPSSPSLPPHPSANSYYSQNHHLRFFLLVLIISVWQVVACLCQLTGAFSAGIHAREWISPATVTYLMRELGKNSFCGNNDKLQQVTKLI